MVKDKRKLLTTIRKRQLEFIGHVVRDQGIEILLLKKRLRIKELDEDKQQHTWME